MPFLVCCHQRFRRAGILALIHAHTHQHAHTHTPHAHTHTRKLHAYMRGGTFLCILLCIRFSPSLSKRALCSCLFFKNRQEPNQIFFFRERWYSAKLLFSLHSHIFFFCLQLTFSLSRYCGSSKTLLTYLHRLSLSRSPALSRLYQGSMRY